MLSGSKTCLRPSLPLLSKFKYSSEFAVHQINSWIRRRQDLNKMLPALAAYMGYAALESTERYLQLTPERFRGALDKLSPQKSHTLWRDDPALLEFLAHL